MSKETSDYISYEYKDVKVSEDKMPFYLDCYESLGWETDPRVPYKHGVLTIRRDHKLVNQVELTRLLRNFEACMDTINKMENSKTSEAVSLSLTLGMCGAGLITGSVFAAVAKPPVWWLCVLLGALGIACCSLPPALFTYLKNWKSKKVETLMEQKYEEVYAICEKGHRLLDH